MLGKGDNLLIASLRPLARARQHRLCSHPGFGTTGSLPQRYLSALSSRMRHSFRLLLGCGLRLSTSLHPFAPPALPGFLATMGALTPAGQLHVVVPLFAPFRPRLKRKAWTLDLTRRPRPRSSYASAACPRQVSLLYVTEPSSHSASNHHSSPPGSICFPQG